MKSTVALEITIYLTLGALISLGGLVALNVMLDAPKFDFPSLTEALLADGLGIATKRRFWITTFGFGILVALFLFILDLVVTQRHQLRFQCFMQVS